MNDPELLGIIAIVIMVGSYTLENRATILIATFALGCAMAAFYAWLTGSTPFLKAEGIWADSGQSLVSVAKENRLV